MAKEALSLTQEKIKHCFDKKAVVRSFLPGEKVLNLIPTPGSTFTVCFLGLYVVKSEVSETDYIIHTPDRRRITRLCHVYMLKPYLCHNKGKDETVNASMSEFHCLLIPCLLML